jgi:hypothetical protein
MTPNLSCLDQFYVEPAASVRRSVHDDDFREFVSERAQQGMLPAPSPAESAGLGVDLQVAGAVHRHPHPGRAASLRRDDLAATRERGTGGVEALDGAPGDGRAMTDLWSYC